METTNATQTLDVSGNGYHASNLPSVAAGPTWTIGSTNENGRVEHFYIGDDSDDEFLTTATNIANGVTQYSVMCWVNIQDDGNTFEGMVGSYSDEDGIMLRTRTSAADFQIYAGTAAGASFINSTNIVAENSWHHIAGTWDGADGDINLFIDGVDTEETPAASAATGALIVNRALRFLNDDSIPGGTRFLDGYIDDIRLYDKILSDAEIVAVFSNTPPVLNLTGANAGGNIEVR